MRCKIFSDISLGKIHFDLNKFLELGHEIKFLTHVVVPGCQDEFTATSPNHIISIWYEEKKHIPQASIEKLEEENREAMAKEYLGISNESNECGNE